MTYQPIRSVGHLVRVLLFAVLFQIPALSAATYYVDSRGGNDSNDGLSPGRAWASLIPVQSRIKRPGDDLLLRAGSVFEDQRLLVNWGGIETDWANVGCYTLGSTGEVAACGTADKLPEVNGTFEPSCAASRQCLIQNPAAVPQKIQTGLVHVNASYVAVRQIMVRDSAGLPIVFASNERLKRHHFILEDVKTEHSVRRVALIGSHYQHGVIRRVHGTLFGLCEQYKYAECAQAGWSGGIVVHGSPQAMILMEDNLVHDGFGEAFNCLRSSHVVMRGNRAGDVHSNTYYLDNCSNTIVENNIAWGDLDNTWGANGAFAGVSVNMESYNPSSLVHSTNNVIRNNLITGLGQCIRGSQSKQAVELGFKVGFHAYGNSCVGLRQKNMVVHKNARNVDQIIVQNNIFFSPGATESSCVRKGNGRVVFNQNLWDGKKGYASCGSPTDVVGDPMLVGTPEQFARFSSSYQPTAQHFALKPGSPALGLGKRLEQQVFNAQEMQPVTRLVSNGRCQIRSEALTRDFHCADRQSNASMGAIDRTSYAPLPPMNVSIK